MSRPTAWARHFQHVWQERAGDPRLPAWLRVAALAYGSHAANGHAMFKPGQIGLVLGSVDPATGEVKPMEKNNVQRAIRAAIDYGWIGATSGSTCLVVPGHAITGGIGGRADMPCPQQHRRRPVRHSLTDRHPSGTSLSDPPVRHSATTAEPSTSTNVASLYESSLDLSERARPRTRKEAS